MSLLDLVAGKRTVVLAGAGLSTDSGIPDYRGPGRVERSPLLHRDFVRSARVRARYWARSLVGWPRMASAQPNPGHLALAALESAGHVAGVITQNVDGLHHAAGSRRVVELHGSLAEVRCLSCGRREKRAELQDRMRTLNPEFHAPAVAFAPDGDADLDDTDGFVVPDCLGCGGVLKPDVVFFGDNVGMDVVAAAWKLFDEAQVLLVVGSSLTVWSGFRFVRRAAERALPVGIVNLGPTRGDELARVRIAEPLGEVLPQLARDLGVAV